MSTRIRNSALPWIGAFLCLVVGFASVARERGTDLGGNDNPRRVLVIDGSPVHNVGNLDLHIPNWGMFGSMPNSGMPFQGAPSAEWPAGSGVEYLFSAGLWIGAINGGVPAVSTAAYEFEFRPTVDPIDVVYYAGEGDPGGNRLPDPNADDDGDGAIDEEWLDGRDNDGDALIDEDFAAISEQMLSSWYTDDQPEAVQIYPEHEPMHLLVRQQSFQWSNPDFDDFVGIDYTITNTGNSVLEDVYVGVFVDGDVGDRNTPNYYADDATDFMAISMVCTPWGATPVDFGFVYDADGDMGQATGYCGVLMLDHTTDPTGAAAPAQARFVTYQVYTGNQPFENGGDPTNDFERYESMASELIDAGVSGPSDVRFMVAAGPFPLLGPGETLEFTIALFVGDASLGWTEVTRNAAAAKLVYQGKWYDIDADPNSGVAGRETPVYGPATNVVVDSCQSPPVIVPSVPAGEVVWVNRDCALEEEKRVWCGYTEADSAEFRTGVAGREHQIHWKLPLNPPVPVFVTQFDVRTQPDAAVLSWDIFADEPMRGFSIRRTNAEGRTQLLPSANALIAEDVRGFVDRDVSGGQTYEYTLVAVLGDGSEQESRVVEAVIPVASTELHQNNPNPFNPATSISFTLASTQAVTLSIFTADGKLVTTLVDEVLPEGLNSVGWDGTDALGNPASSGIYFYRLEAGKFVQSRKMILLK